MQAVTNVLKQCYGENKDAVSEELVKYLVDPGLQVQCSYLIEKLQLKFQQEDSAPASLLPAMPLAFLSCVSVMACCTLQRFDGQSDPVIMGHCHIMQTQPEIPELILGINEMAMDECKSPCPAL